MAKSKTPSWLRLLPLAALGFALAGSGSVAEAKSSSETEVDKPFLWKVDGAVKPSYLFGTIHAGVSMQDLPGVVGQAVSQSDAFVMETRPTKELLVRTRNSGQFPMDFALAETASRSRKPVLGLESLRFQLNLMHKLGGGQDMAAMLAEDPQAIASLTDAYRSGDLGQIAEQTECEDTSIREMLFSRRNHRWAAQLESGLRRGGLFVAVGVGHFPGDDGVLRLLDQRGFSISRVATS